MGVIHYRPPNSSHSHPLKQNRGAGVGVDSAWEQEKPEARKMLAVGAEIS